MSRDFHCDYRLGDRLCTQFDTHSLLSITKEIEACLEKFKPTIVLTHNPSEVNIDHRITHQAVEVACRPTREWIPKEIYGFEVICSGNWKFDPYFKPNVFIDIEKYWDKKLQAWHQYEGEARPFPFPRSDKGLETLANFRGMASGVKKAEAFRLYRKVI
ncbi:MAG: LmbE family N-acetylglucosaminyl deacetylase [Paracoccaceae bacterium]